MKIFFVRLSVLALAAVGFTASTVISHSQKNPVVAPVRIALMPQALCLPGHGVCGMD